MVCLRCDAVLYREPQRGLEVHHGHAGRDAQPAHMEESTGGRPCLLQQRNELIKVGSVKCAHVKHKLPNIIVSELLSAAPVNNRYTYIALHVDPNAILALCRALPCFNASGAQPLKKIGASDVGLKNSSQAP